MDLGVEGADAADGAVDLAREGDLAAAAMLDHADEAAVLAELLEERRRQWPAPSRPARSGRTGRAFRLAAVGGPCSSTTLSQPSRGQQRLDRSGRPHRQAAARRPSRPAATARRPRSRWHRRAAAPRPARPARPPAAACPAPAARSGSGRRPAPGPRRHRRSRAGLRARSARAGSHPSPAARPGRRSGWAGAGSRPCWRGRRRQSIMADPRRAERGAVIAGGAGPGNAQAGRTGRRH